MKACVFTLGCKLNEVESESLCRGLEERGYETCETLSFADLYFLNTCAVTAEAERKSRQAIARMRKFNPKAPVVVFGCAAQKNAESFLKKEGVTLVFGAQGKGKILDYLDKAGAHLFKDESFCDMPAPKQLKTRAYLRIQDGCNRFCSYCVIPYLRGRSRSREIESVVKEAKECGAKEIVLTGVDVSSYSSHGNTLGDLLLRLKDLPSRIRLGSLETGIVDEEFLGKMKEAKNVVPHFHLSAQSGSNKVLKAMNRAYTRERFLSSCKLIYQTFENAAITTDLIAGFPAEGEAEFEESLSLIEEAGFSRVHAFPFSMREGTAACRFQDLPQEVKRERVERLKKASEAQKERYLSKFLNKEVEVLFESGSCGYSENYIRVYAEGCEGELKKVRLKKCYRDGAFGVPIK